MWLVRARPAVCQRLPAIRDLLDCETASSFLDEAMPASRLASVYPLSPLQEGLLFHGLYEPGQARYVEQTVLELAGEIDAAALEAAFAYALARHPGLRAGFHWQGLDRPLAAVHAEAKAVVAVQDWRRVPADEVEARLAEFLAADRAEGFDLARPPLLRLALLRTADERCRLVWTAHHILLDGWSSSVLLGDLLLAYEAATAGQTPEQPAPRPFADYLTWLAGRDAAAAEAYWRGALAGLEPPVPLAGPAAGPQEVALYGERDAALPAAATAALGALAARNLVTLATVIHGAWALLLSGATGEDEVVFGSTVSGRPEELPGVETMVGLFINTLPVRVRVDPEAALLPWLAALQAAQIAAHAHQHAPLAAIQRWAGLPPGQALFDTLLVVENTPSPQAVPLSSPVRVLGARHHSRTHYPLSVGVEPGESLRIRATFDERRLDGGRVDLLLAAFVGFLAGFAAAPTRTLGEIAAATADAGAAAWPGEADLGLPPLHVQFDAQAARAPERPAVRCEGIELTYRELGAMANRLAHHLVSLGVGAEVPVVSAVPRSPAALAAFLAVLKAGGVYVPVEASAPEERLALLLEDTGAPVLLGGRLPAGATRARRVDPLAAAGLPETPPAVAVSPGQLAYVIYTSGSTGRPKGVGVPHGAAAAHMGVAAARFGVTAGERVLQFTSLAFDAGLEQVATALVAGATLVMRGEERWDTADLGDRLVRERVDVANLPTVFWAQWAERQTGLAEAAAHRPRLVIAGGEAMPAEAVHAWQAGPFAGVRLANAYGPTEGIVTAALAEVPLPAPDPVPLGRTLAGRAGRVLDRRQRPVRPGMVGELCLGGPLLARGYRGDPAATAARFVPDPFSDAPGSRLYRTGDRVRLRPDGEIDFLGRRDAQIKVRGVRIEPAEVEAALRTHPAVREAAVALLPALPGGRERRLTAFVVPAGEPPPAARDLESHLRRSLPAAYVPAAYAVVAALPRTPGGKIDRRALRELKSAVPHGYPPGPPGAPGGSDAPAALEGVAAVAALAALAAEAEVPRTTVEELLAGLWSAVLGVPRIELHDDFLALGGHSLTATLLLSRIREAFQIELPLSDLFAAPTLAAQARRIEAELAAPTALPAPPPLAARPRPAVLPLSFAQRRLWILDRFDPGMPAYDIPLAVRLRGPLDPAAVAASLSAVAARHEALRTRFVPMGVAGEEPEQRIDPPRPLPLPGIDLRALPAPEREAELRRLAAAAARFRFDLARGPLLRAALVRTGDGEHALLLTLHHIVADGWSVGIVWRERAAHYREATGGAPAALPPLPVQYADYALWQRGWLAGEALDRQMAFWRQRLADLPPALPLPIDRPRPPLRTVAGAHVPVVLGPALSAAVLALARGERATPFMVLAAALWELLGRHTGTLDLAVGTPVANRSRVEIEGLVGFFVNTLVLRASLADDPTGRRLVARLRETTLAAYTHQDVPFEKLVEELQPERSLAVTPLFQVLLSLQRVPPPPVLPGLAAERLETATGAVKFDLALAMADDGAELAGVLEYRTDLFDRATVERLAAGFVTLLGALAAAPAQPLSALPMVGEAERHQLLREWNDGPALPARAATLDALVAAQAARTPGAAAVEAERETLSYGQLDRLANRLARRLRAAGVGPEVPVGVFVDRTFEMVVALLGVLKAGGAYVPLDPAYPAERLALMLGDCGAPVVVTQEWLLDRLPEGGERLTLDPGWESLDGVADGPLPALAVPASLAYVIYTSGSTGRPKGVAIEHRSAVALLAWAATAFSPEERARVLATTSLCFDLSVFELFLPLATGGTVVLAGSALDLLEVGQSARATLLNTVPSALAELVRTKPLPPSVRTVNLAGEPIPPPLAAALAATGRRLWNLYGPSEATTYATAARLEASEAGRPAPIGRPIAGTAALVLDGRLRPVPLGATGEIYLAGAGLARGYLGLPARTAAAFLPHPFAAAPGERVYRTGDLARQRADGRLEFLGRRDSQVKVRGYRIELGEVEAALARLPAVTAAAVAVREDVPGDRRLVAYAALAPGASLDLAALQEALRRTLPEPMLPGALVVLAELPRTASGKVDRAALPAPGLGRAAGVHVEPVSPLERAVAAVMREALGVERVGRDDSFFQLGGHSLLMIRAAGLLEQRLGRKVQVIELFRFPTVAALAAFLDEGDRTAPSGEEMAQRGEERRQVRGRRRDLREAAAGAGREAAAATLVSSPPAPAPALEPAAELVPELYEARAAWRATEP